jgi:hypothetical protein
MRSIAFVATVMLMESAVAFSIFKKQPLSACGPCPRGVDCRTWCTSSTVRTVSEQSCTTCRTVSKPIPVKKPVVQKPVAFVIPQPSVTAYASKPVSCPCTAPSCGPCVAPQPVVQQIQVSCSFNCVTPGCIPCPPAKQLPVQPLPQSVIPPRPAQYTTQNTYGFSCSISCYTRGCIPCPPGTVSQIQPSAQAATIASALPNEQANQTTVVIIDGNPVV